MLASLDALPALPEATRVFPAHEYTLANLRFAQAVEPGNEDLADLARRAAALRQAGEPTLPSTIGTEKRINPFLRCRVDDVRKAAERHAGRSLPTPTSVFAAVRGWKDGFQ